MENVLLTACILIFTYPKYTKHILAIQKILYKVHQIREKTM